MSGPPYRVLLHPLVPADISAIGRHVAEASGDRSAGRRRVAEAEALIGELSRTPLLGVPLSGPLEGFRRRHGGSRRRLTVIYQVLEGSRIVRVHLVTFGGANWADRVSARSG